MAEKAEADMASSVADVSVAACAVVIACTFAEVSAAAAVVVSGQVMDETLVTVVMTIPIVALRPARKTLRRRSEEGRRHDASGSREDLRSRRRDHAIFARAQQFD
jgi:hypothetical protein